MSARDELRAAAYLKSRRYTVPSRPRSHLLAWTILLATAVLGFLLARCTA